MVLASLKQGYQLLKKHNQLEFMDLGQKFKNLYAKCKAQLYVRSDDDNRKYSLICSGGIDNEYNINDKSQKCFNYFKIKQKNKADQDKDMRLLQNLNLIK
ncbi:hypothetical protein PPERSA_02987 [Pseudocohnilembus persalinus]|uniref:Uncharacterized protein n=1 Tax=Pseudocohnilembus persalinus TaxID=266149 RepID=A0A0V0QEW0_PSEPJ|nr:hypothetical protein PPERSA_02987 [Pseudocohnilembus persalinus]|eukprot:KRX00727.1 hypothetical protein PPERSA_02987 [Pseudocohnilembus persalinus]